MLVQLQLRPPRPRVGRTHRLGLVAALAVGVAAVGSAPLPVDLTVQEFLSAHASGTGRQLAALVTQLGGGPVLYSVLLALCLLAARARRSVRALLPLVVLGVGQVLEAVLFASVHRPASDGGLAAAALAGTFSSGHAAAAVLGWGLIARQVRSTDDRSEMGTSAWALALLIGAAVAATRTYLGLHWLSDAVVGVLSGACLLVAGVEILRRAETRWSVHAGNLRSDDGARLDAIRPAASPVGTAVRCLSWARTSAWAWVVPVAAAAVPVGALLLAPGPERLKDLLVYHGAGYVAGAGQDVYAFRTAWSMPFTYPPFAALVLQPLARMPLGLAQLLWTGASLAAVVWLADVALQPVVRRIGLPLTVTALLVSSPVRSHLRFGQIGIFLVLLVSLDLLRRGRGGWGLGLATAVKLTPAVFLPWLLATAQWGRLKAAVAWATGASVLGLVLLWPSSGDYLHRASRDASRFGPNAIPGNQSVRGMLLRALPAPSAERLWLVVALLLVAVGTYHAVRLERGGNRLAAVGVLASLSVAVSPISWVHHLVWLVLPMSALAAAGRYRLLCAWFAVLVLSLPSLGHGAAVVLPGGGFLWALIIDAQGLTAVAAVLLLPALVADRSGPIPRSALV